MISTFKDLTELRDALRQFSAARDWRQYHSPKNLAMAMIVEAAELVEHFQWSTEEESRNLSPEKLSAVRDEVADTFVYLVEIADALNIDLLQAAHDKMQKNALKYPAPTVPIDPIASTGSNTANATNTTKPT